MALIPCLHRRHRHRFLEAREIVAVTGAGVSVASGLPTFRGPGGVWDAGTFASVDAANLEHRAGDLWETTAGFRRLLATARPNPAHRALASWENGVEAVGGTFLVVTQNGDGLHQAAGSRAVAEIHGSFLRSRCSTRCSSAFDDPDPADGVPACARCGSPLRPDVVLFGEPLDLEAQHVAKRALRSVEVFVAVGTSGAVATAEALRRAAAYSGGLTILVDPEPDPRFAASFDDVVTGPAERVLPELAAWWADSGS